MPLLDLFDKYTDDHELAESTALFLHYFSVVETPEGLMSTPMEYFINIPHITVGMCELIDKVKRNEQ